MERKRWYAVYTKPRWEKKVNRLLLEQGIQSYCPLNKVRRKWSDRMKVVEEPLFKSYVFVCIGESNMSRVRTLNGVVNFVYWVGRPAVIKEKEIEIIQKFLGEYKDVQARLLDVKVEAKVRIETGPLMHKEGIVSKLMRKKVEVTIESIGYVLTAYIDKNNISVIEK